MRDKLCVVTGTSSGIGKSVAEVLIRHEWQVLGISRRPAPIRHEAYRHVSLDLADLDALVDHFEHRFETREFLARCSRVGLVNNAALLGPVGPISQLSAAELARACAVNVVAPVWLMGYMVRTFRTVPVRVVNVSSGAAVHPRPGWTAYCSTKAALRMAGLVLGAEVEQFPAEVLGTHNVAVVNYAPGAVDTEMQAEVRDATPEQFPEVQRFVGFFEQGQLLPPERPAAEIAALLERDDLPAFSDRQVGQ